MVLGYWSVKSGEKLDPCRLFSTDDELYYKCLKKNQLFYFI